ncbi:MAG: hypothetical protein M3Y05_16380 [Gemmatimonadota bacterium]|nr:hypothetical protein [Gemmatimonadota bacterium]
MIRTSLAATAVILCACSSGNSGRETTQAPDLRSTLQLTRVDMPNGASIEIDWEHQHTYEETKLLVGVDKAWSEYPTVFGELGIEPNVIDSKQHVFGNAGVKVRGSLGRQRLSRYIDCGATAGMANADQYDIIVRVVSQVIPADAGLSTIRTQVEANGRASGESSTSARCVSTGALEARIARMMSELATKSGN